MSGITLVMTMKNRHAKNKKGSEAKSRELTRLFGLNLDTTQIAVLTGLNCNIVTRFLKALRKRIALNCEIQFLLSGKIKVDESYFESDELKLRLF